MGRTGEIANEYGHFLYVQQTLMELVKCFTNRLQAGLAGARFATN